MSRFSNVPERTGAQARCARERPLPASMARVRKPMGRGELILTTRFRNLDDVWDLRTVHIVSPKIEVLTCFLFPEPDRALPVYGMELVMLGRRPVIGVADLVDLNAGGSAGRNLLADAHRHFPSLPASDDMPEWFAECRSGSEFFMRPDEVTALEALAEVHHHLVDGLLALPAETPAADPQAHGAAIADYKHHHRIHSPGLPLMNSLFGADWTDRYMDEHLFA
jgi:hypothetical protein